MKKFTIDDVTITKSVKDIETGVKRTFTGGINVVFGSNETGKSSLMNFIKTALFKGSDCGIINFSISDENLRKKYRADIKDFGRLDKRLTLYDENGNNCDNSLISEVINKNYFEQGFTITLDDLMSIKNKDNSTLVDAIKDPTGQLLQAFEEEIKLKIKKLYGDNNRPTKELNNISNEITAITNEINRQQGNEELYNSAIRIINEADENLLYIKKQEKYEELKNELKAVEAEYNNLKEQTEIAKSKFNNKFYEQKQSLSEIIKNAGVYELNCSQIDKLKNKLADLKEKIFEMQNTLKTEYGFITDFEFIKNFSIEKADKTKIKNLLSKKNELSKTIAVGSSQKENSLEALFKSDLSLKSSENEIINEDVYENTKKLYSELKTETEHYSSLSLKENELNDKCFDLNKRYVPGFIIAGTVIATGVYATFSGILFNGNKTLLTGILFLFIGIIGFLILLYKYKNNGIKTERNRITALKNSVLSALKSDLEKNNVELTSDEPTYITVKINEILNELRLKSEKYEKLKENILNQKQENEILNEKIRKNNEFLSSTELELQNINDEIKNIIVQNGFGENVTPEEYLEITIILAELQNNIAELENVQKDLNEKQDIENKILTESENFFTETEITPLQGNSFAENTAYLRNYDENNNKQKQIIDELNIKSDILKSKIDELQNKLKHPDFENINTELISLDELKDAKEEILAKKKDAEYTKRNLESVESLNELKIGREIALKEYKRKTAELLKYKLILSLTQKAKADFNKVQPCLTSAEKYLSIITGGKYSKISLETEEIVNGDETVIKKWSELSRGTKEQLYFALRLGYAANYSRDTITQNEKSKPSLPLIIDDAFVNFDEERLTNVFKCLDEFSQTNQVFFFTCRENNINSISQISGDKVNIVRI